ncbi:MAG: cell division protein FtsZ [Elusimicrobia bacterium]|nr:cell division protein FtsZ [Candidatus Obscuribacterium magneticum]
MTRIKFTEDFKEQPAIIRVIGLGGAGGNAVNRMIEASVSQVEFITANTDAQALRRSLAPVRIQLGEKITKGLGVGGNPSLGRQAAEESEERLREVVTGVDMLFVTAGMGGGTGTGSAPFVAKIAKSMTPTPLVVAVVTRPFQFEGLVRSNQASAGIEELRPYVDTLLIIPNDRLFDIIDEKTPTLEAYRVADDVLRQAVQAITDVITTHGLVNVDFADVRSIMSGAGEALMGIGINSGADRAVTAARQAVQSPLLENVSIEGAKGVLVNITGNKNVTMYEVREVMDFVSSATAAHSHVFYGQVFDETLEEKLKVTVIATGFPARVSRPAQERASAGQRKFPAPPLGVGSANPNEPIFNDELRRPAYLRFRNRKLK